MNSTLIPKYWQNKKVLVLGGTGFLGSHLVTRLTELGADVLQTSRTKQTSSGVESMLLDPVEYDNFSQIQFESDVIINCSALDGNGYFKKNHSTEILEVNSQIALNVLKYAHRKRIPNVVLFSSSEIYSAPQHLYLSETDDSYSSSDLDGYKTSKVLLELLANYYASNHKMNVYLPRPSYVYGSNDLYVDTKNSRLIPLLIHKIQERQKISIIGNKDKRINLIFIDDLVDAVLQLVAQQITGPVTITSPETVTFEKIIQVISQLLGTAPAVEYVAENSAHPSPLRCVRLQRIKSDFVPFEKGIELTLRQPTSN